MPDSSQTESLDSQIILGLQRRDHAAIRDLYDLHGRIVYSIVLRIVKDESAAQDLVQEVFLRVWTRAHLFDARRGTPRAWVLSIARNRALDYWRSTARQRHGIIRDLDGDRGELILPPARSSSCFKTEDAVLGKAVLGALSHLNADQRRILELTYFEGLTQSEIAQLLSRPLGTIKSWLRSALITLRAQLLPAERLAKSNLCQHARVSALDEFGQFRSR
jgi:RNA polymerase sigma-70 factor, ECF subfamily